MSVVRTRSSLLCVTLADYGYLQVSRKLYLEKCRVSHMQVPVTILRTAVTTCEYLRTKSRLFCSKANRIRPIH